MEDTIKGMAKDIDNLDGLDNYSFNFNATDLMEHIDNKIKDKLKEQEEAINMSIIKKLEDININNIEYKIVNNISYNIQNLMDKLCSSTNTALVEEIENKAVYLVDTANNIGFNNTLQNVVMQLDNLYSTLEDIEINNKAYGDLTELNLDNLNNRFR